MCLCVHCTRLNVDLVKSSIFSKVNQLAAIVTVGGVVFFLVEFVVGGMVEV